jgi:hypothetical protein
MAFGIRTCVTLLSFYENRSLYSEWCTGFEIDCERTSVLHFPGVLMGRIVRLTCHSMWNEMHLSDLLKAYLAKKKIF